MQHYFIDKQHNKEDYFQYTDQLNGVNYTFNSVDNMFSKDSIDEGTRVLLNTVIKNYNIQGDVLDMGCGLGVIGIVLNKTYSVCCDMVDVNNTAKLPQGIAFLILQYSPSKRGVLLFPLALKVRR